MSLAELWSQRRKKNLKKVLCAYLAKGFSSEIYICSYASVSQRALFVILEFGRVWTFWCRQPVRWFFFCFFLGWTQAINTKLTRYSITAHCYGVRTLWRSVHKGFFSWDPASILSCFMSYVDKQALSFFFFFLNFSSQSLIIYLYFRCRFCFCFELQLFCVSWGHEVGIIWAFLRIIKYCFTSETEHMPKPSKSASTMCHTSLWS